MKEVGNIFASAYLASLDNQLQLRALPSPPQGFLVPAGSLFSQQQIKFPAGEGLSCILKAGEEAVGLQVSLYLHLEQASLEVLRKAL